MREFSIAICDDLESERISLARMVQSYARERGISVRLRLFSSGEGLLEALRTSEDIRLLYYNALEHRIVPDPQARLSGRTPHALLAEVWESVPSPKAVG